MVTDGMQAVVINAKVCFIWAGNASRSSPSRAVRPVLGKGGSRIRTLVSYGADQRAIARRVANYVDRILKASGRDIPVGTTYSLQLGNQSHHRKSLGLTVPPTLLARADEVIE